MLTLLHGLIICMTCRLRENVWVLFIRSQYTDFSGKIHFRNGNIFISPDHPCTLRINTLLLKTETNQSHTYGLKRILE